MESGAFNWQSLGKADYSQAAALVASLPANLRDNMNGSAKELLCRLTFLMWHYALHSGRGKAYAIPSEAYLARAISRSERTVRRIMVTLRTSGLLTWKRRMTATGCPTSNLYELGKTFLASLFARGKKKLQRNQDRTKMADNDLKREYKADASPAAQPFVPPDWMKARPVRQTDPWGSAVEGAYQGYEKGVGQVGRQYAPEVNDQWDIADAKDVENQRRVELRKQAEMLRKRGL